MRDHSDPGGPGDPPGAGLVRRSGQLYSVESGDLRKLGGREPADGRSAQPSPNLPPSPGPSPSPAAQSSPSSPSAPAVPPHPAAPGPFPRPIADAPPLDLAVGMPEGPEGPGYRDPRESSVMTALPDDLFARSYRRTTYRTRRAGGPAPEETAERPPSGPKVTTDRAEPSLARASRTMAIASMASRLTGFARQVALAAAVGLSGELADGFNTANYLPNMVYELLLGGVLTSIIVPLLVHAQTHDADRGQAYAQRLITLALVTLTIGTVIVIFVVPALLPLFGISGAEPDQLHTASLLARLLLPEMIFYGLGAILGAILNTRASYGPYAWAPVLNNVVVVATAAVFLIMPGPKSLSVHTVTTPQLLVLGIGTTLGIVAQTIVLLPSLRKVGFHWGWRLDLRGSGLGRDSTLLLWVLSYVAVSQIGLAVIVHLANSAPHRASDASGYGVYANVSLLFQTPYGIVGVALLTALLPRMSRAAAVGDTGRLVADLSLGARLTALGLIPVTAAFIVLGPAITTTIFSHGNGSYGSAHAAGVALSACAFGLLPYAITLLQLRAFYAVKDARTPTVINIVMVVVRVLLCLLVPYVVDADHVVAGLSVANSLSFVFGMVYGQYLLRRRFGPVGTGPLCRLIARLALASAVGAAVAWALRRVIVHQLGTTTVSSAVSVVACSVLGGLVMVLVAAAMHIEELRSLTAGLRRRFSG